MVSQTPFCCKNFKYDLLLPPISDSIKMGLQSFQLWHFVCTLAANFSAHGRSLVTVKIQIQRIVKMKTSENFSMFFRTEQNFILPYLSKVHQKEVIFDYCTVKSLLRLGFQCIVLFILILIL